MIEIMEGNSLYRAPFEAFEKERAGKGPSWIDPLRKAAYSRFSELGFPTRHDEEWKYTVVTPIAETAFRRTKDEDGALSPADLARVPFGPLVSDRNKRSLVFVNGRFAPALSSVGSCPPGVKFGSLAQALETDAGLLEPYLGRLAGFEHQPFTALNTAFLEDGAFVYLPRGAVVEEPLTLLYLATAPDEPVLSHPRTLIVAEENSRVTVIESYVGLAQEVSFTNAVTEIVVGENAHVDHVKLQQESYHAFHIANMFVQLARSSRFSSHSIALGGALVRNEVGAKLGGEGGECTLNGLYLADGRRLVDNHTVIDHAMPHCASHEVYKGILDNQARGVFNGKIFVRQDAQKTDAKQTNKTLLLSAEATINTKPQLEIFADDVKCTHGATVGQLDPTQLFYLRARGIGEEEARNLLIYAFAGDIIDRIQVEAVRKQLSRALFAQLAKITQEEI